MLKYININNIARKELELSLIMKYYRALKLALSIAWVKETFEIDEGVYYSSRLGWKTAWEVASDIHLK